MPKTFGLSFTNEAGKICSGVAADNHMIYGIFKGLPTYSLAIVGITSLFWVSLGRTVYDKIKDHQETKSFKDENEEAKINPISQTSPH